jgi:predicted RNA-binding Zn-ribbon protein involved in translation (DUF1610 family)
MADQTLSCPQCGEPVWQTETFTVGLAVGRDEHGREIVESPQVAVFHPDCWEQFEAEHPNAMEGRPCPTCGATGIQDADESREEGSHTCLDCGGSGYQPATL